MLPRVHGMPYSNHCASTEIAKDAGKQLVVETGNGTMVNSSWTARKLIDDLDAKETLKVLWDPANNCWCHETAYPDGYELLREGYIAHIHIKDVYADTQGRIWRFVKWARANWLINSSRWQRHSIGTTTRV